MVGIIAFNYECVRVKRCDGSRYRGYGINFTVGGSSWWVNRDSWANHCVREDGVGDLFQGHDDARHGRQNRQGHRRLCICSARSSASGPTTTWTIRPECTTPKAPAAFNCSSSTFWGSATCTRKRVMHGSSSTMFSAPPRAEMKSCALLIASPFLQPL